MQSVQSTLVLDEILKPITQCLTVENARQLLDHRPRRQVLARIEKLARKCNEGELTPEALAEYESYVFAGEFLALLQAKVKAILSKSALRAELLAALNRLDASTPPLPLPPPSQGQSPAPTTPL